MLGQLDWHENLFGQFPQPFYAGISDYDEGEYDTPVEYDMDDYQGSFISEGEQEEGSRDSTPGLEHYEDAQSERSHSPSQLSDSSNHPNQYRRQSIEIEFVDEPVYPGLNAEAEDSTNPSDSEDNRQVFRARERNHHQVIFTDDENDYTDDEGGSQYGSD